MRRPRPFLHTILGVVIAAGCANEATGPSAHPRPELALSSTTELLSCSATAPVSVSTTIGNKGGTLWIGSHSLVVPKGALQGQPVTITAKTGGSLGNQIEFGPEGLQFRQPATLRFGAGNCSWGQIKQFWVAYLSDDARVLELSMATSINNRDKTISGQINHFSRYAVAY